MAGTVKIKRSYMKLNPSERCGRVWSISVEVESTIDGLDSNMFVFQAAPVGDALGYDRFSNVASLEDMNLLPVDEPATTTDEVYENAISFYRTNKVTLDFYAPEQVDRFWRIVQLDIKNLVRDFHSSVNLKNNQELEIDESGNTILGESTYELS